MTSYVLSGTMSGFAVLMLVGIWWITRLRAQVKRLTRWHSNSETQKLDAHRIGRERKQKIKDLTEEIRNQRVGHAKQVASLQEDLNRARRTHAASLAAQISAQGRMQDDMRTTLEESLNKMRWALNAALEPPKGSDCTKIRFHRKEEAESFARDMEQATGGVEGSVLLYRCRVCPRSPWTIQKFFHVTSNGRREELPYVRSRTNALTRRIDDDTIAQLRQRVNGE